jgi:hypothetical protein
VVQTFTAALGTQLKKFFDGSIMGQRDFIMNTANQGNLVIGLTNFFGRALGCSDNSIPARVGAEPNLKVIHAGMGIAQDDFDLFNKALLGVLGNFKGLGVGVNPKFVGPVSAFLNTSVTDICSKCGQFQAASICEKWASAAGVSQLALIQGAVLAVFGDLTAMTSKTRPFFDGTVPCQSRNFIDNKLNQASLAKRLIAFFGQPGVLGCSDPSFPAYDGNPDMEDVHKEMPITQDLFDIFLNSLVKYTTDNLKAAVPTFDADLAAVAALFASPGVAKICNQPGCATQGKYTARVCDVPTAVPGDTTGTGTNGGSDGTTTKAENEDSSSLASLALSVIAVCVAFFAL